MTNKLDELALQTFLDNQEQLFPEPVADTPEEAEAFLEDCLAVVLDNKRDVIDYIGDSMDIDIQENLAYRCTNTRLGVIWCEIVNCIEIACFSIYQRWDNNEREAFAMSMNCIWL